MKFLCCSDLHGELQAKGFMLEMAAREKPDAILLAGDLSDGSIAFVEDLFGDIDKAGFSFYAVHGNSDPTAVQEFIASSGHGIHGKSIIEGGVCISGIGGSPITPFFTECEYSEKEIATILSKLDCKKGDLLLSHFPPKGGQADLTLGGVHAGSGALREFIQKNQPAALVCGHIHERQLTEKIGNTAIVKVGPLMQKKAALLSIPGAKVKFI